MAASTIKVVRGKFYRLIFCCQMDFDIEKMFLEVTFIGQEIKDDFCRMKPLLIRLKALGISLRLFQYYQPIITVGQPEAILPPWSQLSPARAAGLLSMRTVAEP